MKKEKLREIIKYKNYPEGSGMKRHYDSVTLSFLKFLKKYYSNPDLTTWNKWQKDYLRPSFDKNRYKEMIDNFGYVSIDNHDFDKQRTVYNKLESDSRLDIETRRFIGFLAGTNFFKNHKITTEEWLNMRNWNHPEMKNKDGKTINEILDYPLGLNMLKVSLPQMAYWKR